MKKFFRKEWGEIANRCRADNLLFTVGLVALLFTVGLVGGFLPSRRRLLEVGRRLTMVPFAHHTKINAPGSVEPAWTAQTQDVSRMPPTACGCRYHGPGHGPQHSRRRGQPNLEPGRRLEFHKNFCWLNRFVLSGFGAQKPCCCNISRHWILLAKPQSCLRSAATKLRASPEYRKEVR